MELRAYLLDHPGLYDLHADRNGPALTLSRTLLECLSNERLSTDVRPTVLKDGSTVLYTTGEKLLPLMTLISLPKVKDGI